MITKLGENLAKSSDLYAHATSEEGLSRILSDGKLLSLGHIAKQNPDMEISVEPDWFPIRKIMPAKDAYESMKENKNPDKIFFSKGGYLPNYGDFVIVKKFGNSVREHDALNFIPNEFTTRRRVSLKNNAKIYVPDEKFDDYTKAYHKYRIYPKSKLDLPAYGISDRIIAFYEKLKNRFVKEGGDNQYKKLFGQNAMLVGSEALGINVPGSSDTDVFVPYKYKGAFTNAIARMGQKYPDLRQNEASRTREDKKTFTGIVWDKPIDVVLAYGGRAQRFKEAFKNAYDKLDDDKKAKIVQRKKELKDSWFFPTWRYKRYKKQLAEELGLREAYF